jgi:hypothetical protein
VIVSSSPRHQYDYNVDQWQTAVIALLIISISGVFMSPVASPWQIVATIVASSALAILTWAHIIKPLWRMFQMRKPAKISCIVDRGASDIREEYIYKVEQNSEFNIEYRIDNLINFSVNEIGYCLDGDIENKPEPLSMFQPFIKKGIGKERDFDSEGHYLSNKNNYHIKIPHQRNKTGNSPIGFIYNAKEPGDYPVRIIFYTTEGDREIKTDIIIRVMSAS